jgi:hypothetical protein
MKFLAIYRTPERSEPPSAEHMAEMGRLIEEMTADGTLLATEGCLPTALGARVRLDNGRVTVTDGPFTESKEVVRGFALLRVDSKEEAVRLTERFLRIAGDGESELRRIYDPEDVDAAGGCMGGEHASAGAAAVA